MSCLNMATGVVAEKHQWRWLGPAAKVTRRWVTSAGVVSVSSHISGRTAPWHERSDCDAPIALECKVCREMCTMACGSRDETVCKLCEMRYRKRVRALVRMPMLVSKPGSLVLLTVTAWGAQRHCVAHLYRDGAGKLQPSVLCAPTVGPMKPGCVECPCSEAGLLTNRREIGQWNAGITTRWNRLITDLRRGDLLAGGRTDFERAEYFRAAETQKRGALHLHVVLRAPRVIIRDDALTGWVQGLAIGHGFGHQVDIQIIGGADLDIIKAARYVAKYVSKSSRADQRAPMPSGNVCVNEDACLLPHRKSLVMGSGGVLRALHFGAPRYRAWTASRRWGLSLGRLVAIQMMYAAGLTAASAAAVESMGSLIRAEQDSPYLDDPPLI